MGWPGGKVMVGLPAGGITFVPFAVMNTLVLSGSMSGMLGWLDSATGAVPGWSIKGGGGSASPAGKAGA